MKKYFTILLSAGLGLAVLFLAGCSFVTGQPAESVASEQESPSEQFEPSPDLSPEEVVRIQVEALQNNDDENRGIALTYRFASPSNKRSTGPLNRFIRMVKTPTYRPMLNHKLAEYAPIEKTANTAVQRVTIIEPNGQATVYRFALSRQKKEPCPGCWMTDSVTIIPTRKQQLKGA